MPSKVRPPRITCGVLRVNNCLRVKSGWGVNILINLLNPNKVTKPDKVTKPSEHVVCSDLMPGHIVRLLSLYGGVGRFVGFVRTVMAANPDLTGFVRFGGFLPPPCLMAGGVHND